MTPILQVSKSLVFLLFSILYTVVQQSLESNRTRSNSTLRTLESSSRKLLTSSPSASSLSSSSGTGKEALLLLTVEGSSFQVPKYLPTPEWTRSQGK